MDTDPEGRGPARLNTTQRGEANETWPPLRLLDAGRSPPPRQWIVESNLVAHLVDGNHGGVWHAL